MKFSKNLKIFIIIIVMIILFCIGFFYINRTKTMKFGNNKNSQEIIEDILNISSYETVIEVEVTSNKNTNQYVIRQKYISPDISEQEILEPTNIKGIKIIKKENKLTLENSNINITKIYNDYEYMTDNCLDLNTFIENYKQTGKKEYEEKNNEILLNVENKNNPYTRIPNVIYKQRNRKSYKNGSKR